MEEKTAKQNDKTGTDAIKRFSVIFLVAYVILVIAFYFVTGDKLRFRDSRGNVEMPPASVGTLEMVAGNVVEQQFTTQIQLLEKISIQWGTYERQNSGKVSVKLIKQSTGEVLLHGYTDMSKITNGGMSSYVAAKPIEGVYNEALLLSVTAVDGIAGEAATPIMNTEPDAAGNALRFNGTEVPGRLCFSAEGQDVIWTGQHYWQLAAAGAALLLAYLFYAKHQERKGKTAMLFAAIMALQKYGFLIKQLVARDFKSKYKRSVLGMLWSFLNPLLTMTVQYLVFVNLFRFDIPYYPAYLICGLVVFNFFTEACNMTLVSIVGNAGLITKVYVPKYIYPLTRVMSSGVNLLISLVPLLMVVWITGSGPAWSNFLLLYDLVFLIIFSLGMGMLLASAMVFFRDTQFLWGIISMLWMYMTPLFYPESILPKGIDIILKINPMHFYVKFARICMIEGVTPEPRMYLQCMVSAILALILGAYVFKKTQDKFVLYL